METPPRFVEILQDVLLMSELVGNTSTLSGDLALVWFSLCGQQKHLHA